MALPKQRHTRHRRDRARKQYDAPLVNTVACPKCEARMTAHRACPNCGTYKGRTVVAVDTPKLAKKSA
jgi:large subunit ribosomal protein L32